MTIALHKPWNNSWSGDFLPDLPSVGLLITILIGFIWLCTFCGLTLFNPLLDAFGFRQTQTALNVYSILHDHVFLAYWTPVLGAPWSLPLEAPVYHGLVALFTSITGLDLDGSGRVVSLVLFFGTIACGYKLVHSLIPNDRYAPKLFVLFALVSPLYVFWARTFMVETCALFFGMAWLTCMVVDFRKASLWLRILSIPLCVLAALAKTTTWPAFVAAYGIYVSYAIFSTRIIPVRSLLVGCAGVLLALSTTLVWMKYSDQLKMLNPFGGYLTSASLRHWTFGDWSQLFSEKLWVEILPYRMLPDAIGYCWPVLFVCFRYVRMYSARTMIAFASGVLFFVPIVIFTNLHIIHDYYQTANAVFLVAAVTFLLSELIAVRKAILATIIGGLLIIGSLARFYNHEWRYATAPLLGHFSYVAGKIVKETTSPESSLIVFGVDWSSEVNYYAKRKGLALPLWATPDQTRMILGNPDAAMGGLKVGAVVDCRPVGQKYSPPLDSVITEFMNTWAHQLIQLSDSGSAGTCAVFVKSNAR